ncbi:MAG: PhzF family phenazine biosynthesis protein [Undibacterium sp.]|nr:PhzF family phenazine biosynthesis protein [Undibacterium sp.]
MPNIKYRLLNVFAETKFGGNPLAVVEDGRGLNDQEMQLIARQFNLSETSFIFPSTKAAAQIRIFTPAYEMAFAGHPALGSAQVVREIFDTENEFQLEMKAGLIPVILEKNQWNLFANSPIYRPMLISRMEIAAMLNLPMSAIADTPLWVNCGTEQPMIPLTNTKYVHACRPDPKLLAKYGMNSDGQIDTYVFARTTNGFESRHFWMTDETSVREDPGTGSACANLGGWWMSTEGNTPLSVEVRQGTIINRPNMLNLNVRDGKIKVGGRVIEIGSGELYW